MKYLLCDIDGTIADSRHRSNLLPMYPGTRVESARVEKDGIKLVGHVVRCQEIADEQESRVTVSWQGIGERSYSWTQFMAATDASWKPWHDAIPGDTPIQPILYVLQAMRPRLLRDGIAVLFLTSRHESSRDLTLAQLHEFGATFETSGDILEMRGQDDPRKDTVYKAEVLDRYEAAGHSFILALEDRGTVARFLRARGITTLHVADYE